MLGLHAELMNNLVVQLSCIIKSTQTWELPLGSSYDAECEHICHEFTKFPSNMSSAQVQII